jgi:hypothetical protein
MAEIEGGWRLILKMTLVNVLRNLRNYERNVMDKYFIYVYCMYGITFFFKKGKINEALNILYFW